MKLPFCLAYQASKTRPGARGFPFQWMASTKSNTIAYYGTTFCKCIIQCQKSKQSQQRQSMSVVCHRWQMFKSLNIKLYVTSNCQCFSLTTTLILKFLEHFLCAKSHWMSRIIELMRNHKFINTHYYLSRPDHQLTEDQIHYYILQYHLFTDETAPN